MFDKIYFFPHDLFPAQLNKNYSYKNSFKDLNLDSRLILTTIFFLVCKDEKYYGKMDVIINSYLKSLKIILLQRDKKDLKKLILKVELQLLQQIGYQLNIQTADYFLQKFFLKYPIEITQATKNIARNLLNKLMLFSNLSIVYQPWILAMASLECLPMNNVHFVPNFGKNKELKWWEYDIFTDDLEKSGESLVQQARKCIQIYRKLRRKSK